MKFSKNSPKSKSIERIQNSSPFNSINKKKYIKYDYNKSNEISNYIEKIDSFWNEYMNLKENFLNKKKGKNEVIKFEIKFRKFLFKYNIFPNIKRELIFNEKFNLKNMNFKLWIIYIWLNCIIYNNSIEIFFEPLYYIKKKYLKSEEINYLFNLIFELIQKENFSTEKLLNNKFLPFEIKEMLFPSNETIKKKNEYSGLKYIKETSNYILFKIDKQFPEKYCSKYLITPLKEKINNLEARTEIKNITQEYKDLYYKPFEKDFIKDCLFNEDENKFN